MTLAEVPSPFAVARQRNIDLPMLLDSDPIGGHETLRIIADEIELQIHDLLEQGLDGILYVLHGAHPNHTTPMQYGGHFLERDREILAEIENATLNLVFVVGGEGTYLDFVSDLPAHAFGWDSQATGVTPTQMRQMRQGALATNHPDADIDFRFGTANVSEELDMRLRGVHAI